MATNEKILKYRIAGSVDPSVTRTASEVINQYSKIEGLTVKQKRAADVLTKAQIASAAASVKSAQAELNNAKASEVRGRSAERTARSVAKVKTEIDRQIASENRAARQSEAMARQVERDYDRRAKAIESSYGRAIAAHRRAESAGGGGGLRASVMGGIKEAAISTLPLAGAAAIGQAAVGELQKATKLASDLNETIQKSEQIFGKSEAAGIAAWAEGAAKSMGLAKGEAIESTAVFGNLFRIANLTGAESADLSKQMATLAGDMASFNNADPSEVLKNIQSGLSGEMEPLRKFGVFLSEARVKAEAFAEGIAKPVKNAAAIAQAHATVEIAVAKLTRAQKKYGEGSVEVATAQLAVDRANGQLEKALQGSGKELTSQEKILARVKLLLKDTAVQQGDFARTAKGAANQERILNAELQNLETRLGAKLLPARIGFIKFLSDWVETGDKAVNVTDRLGQKIERIINLPTGKLGDILGALGKAAFGSPLGAGINYLDNVLKNRDRDRRLGASPGGQLSAASDAAKQIAEAKRTGRSSPQLLETLRGLGVDTRFRGYSGEFQAMLDHGSVEAQNRIKASQPAVRSDMMSRLMGAYAPAKSLPKKKPDGMTGNGGGATTGGNDLYSGADRNAEAKRAAAEAKAAREKAKKDAEEAAKRTLDNIRGATHETLESYVDYLQNALEAALKTFEEKLPEGKLNSYRKGLGGLLDDLAEAKRAVARATYRDDVARDPKNTQTAQARLDRTLKGIKQDRLDASGTVDKAQQGALKRIADAKKEEADKLQDRLVFEAEQFEQDKKEREERQNRLREFAENEIRLLEGVRDNVADLDTQQALTKKILERASALASSDFFGGLLTGDTERMMRGLLSGQQARKDFKDSSFDIAKKMAEAHDTWEPPTVRPNRVNAALSQGGDAVWREFDTAGERMATGFLESLVSGRGRRGGMQELLKDVAQDAGRSLAQQAGQGLMREIERPLETVGKKLGKYLMDGGESAGKSIAQAGLTLYGIASILGTQGKKKQTGGILGAVLGGVVGALTGGIGWAAAAGIGAGAGSMLAHKNGGRARGGRVAMFGEEGPEMGIPARDMDILTADQTRNFWNVANGGGSGGSGGGKTITNHLYIEKIDNRAGVDQVKQMLEDERQREAFV